MKKVLLVIFSLFVTCAANAYETVIVDFPVNEGWHEVYYVSQGYEAILQYVPADETYQKWTRTVIFHSYKDPRWDFKNRTNSSRFMDLITNQMELQTPGSYNYIKYSPMDSLARRCTTGSKAQCEIFRSSCSHEGLITMHYINKNTKNFRDTYNQWYDIIRKIKIYYAYYRNDRVFSKSTVFEL